MQGDGALAAGNAAVNRTDKVPPLLGHTFYCREIDIK